MNDVRQISNVFLKDKVYVIRQKKAPNILPSINAVKTLFIFKSCNFP